MFNDIYSKAIIHAMLITGTKILRLHCVLKDQV